MLKHNSIGLLSDYSVGTGVLSFDDWLSKVCKEQPQANFWHTSQKFDLSILQVNSTSTGQCHILISSCNFNEQGISLVYSLSFTYFHLTSVCEDSERWQF